jgi:hypothetical protein
VRSLHVQFASGREVLGHYWGLLSGGGLAIAVGEDEPLAGEQLRLSVHVCSIKKTYLLDVQVLEVRRAEEGTQAMVAFLPQSSPAELLDAAWADGCDAPQRRSRRLPLQAQVRWEPLDGTQMEGRSGRLVNLSLGGCCVEGAALPSPGTQVLLTTLPGGGRASLRLLGRVRWTERPEGGFMGVEFVGPAPGVDELLHSLGAR